MKSFKNRSRSILIYKVLMMIIFALLLGTLVLSIVLECNHIIPPQNPEDVYSFGIFQIMLIFFYKISEDWVEDEATKEMASELENEIKVKKSLNQLPEEFNTLNNLEIKSGIKKIKLDSLVVCPYGVFVIDVNNYEGKINGRKEANSWLKVKMSRSRRSYAEKIQNPLKQLNRQTVFLSELLRNHGIDMSVDGYIVFPSAHSVHSDAENAIKGTNKLNEVLMDKKDIKLSNEDIEKVLCILKGFQKGKEDCNGKEKI